MIAKKPFHINFKLQEKSFISVEELLTFSKQLSLDIFNFLENWFDDNDFVEVKTSGSTGKPKVIKIQKKHMINSALATGKYFNLFENTKALLCLSVNYIAGKMMLVRALTLGWNLDFIESIANPLKITNKKYDFAAMVPLQLESALKDLYKVKKIIVGGAPVSYALLKKLQNLKTEIFATYGMTETVTHIAVKRLNNFNIVIASEAKQSLYQVLPNIKISKDDRDCLVINAPKISDQKIITNDIVELISEKEFKWIGRYDSVINSGGIKLYPEEIEVKLMHVITNPFIIAGINDEKLGKKLILIVEKSSKTEAKEILFEKIKKLQNLTKFQIPKEIYFIKKMVKTLNQKIDRNKTLKQIFKAP
jgi:O-succinylbenzoic acid--CoA ligase